MSRPLLPVFIAALSLACLLAPISGPATAPRSEPHPPIPIRFHLDHPAFVTLVIEDEHGVRVRNLVSETYFPARDNVAWWDGLDDRERDTNSAEHAVYNVPGRLVAPGTYTVGGLYHQKIDLKYEFAIYNPGQPPWMTSDTSSEWLTNHTPPTAVCFVPSGRVPIHGMHDANSPDQVLVGSPVAEGGSGLAWLDLDGKKLHGQMWVGGTWTGAQLIARDLGNKALPGVYAYVASTTNEELRLNKLVNDALVNDAQKKDSQKNDTQKKAERPRDTRLGTGEDRPVLNPTWKYPKPNSDGMAGLAAYNGVLLISLPKLDELLFVDAGLSRVIGTYPLPKPGGLFADGKGSLFVISEKRVLKIALPEKLSQPGELGKPQVVVANGLEDPQQMTMDTEQNLYVSDWGASNQVKIFSTAGKLMGLIGIAGVAVSGPYDPTLMHHPDGVAIDSRKQLWVAEQDFQPKRVSVWTLDGHLLRAFYGPGTYGGGGNLDPKDKTLFYLDGMTFRLNWNSGESTLIAIQHRATKGESDRIPVTAGDWASPPFQESGSRNKQAGASENPDLPIYVAGHKYFTNAYNSDPTGSTAITGIWMDKGGVAVPVGAFGRADSRQVFLTAAFRSHIGLPANRQNDPGKPLDLSGYTFAWSDLNNDGIAEPDEITMVAGSVHAVTVSANLELVTDTAVSYKPVTFTAAGVPVYDLRKGEVLCPQTQKPTSTGGGQVLATESGWTVLTTGPQPFASQSVAGAEHGTAKWSYPSLWPGLHASHIAPVPDFPGELIGTTRLLGPSFRLGQAKDIELWAINGNKGNIYLFTTDGLFVATLFEDSRSTGSSWAQQPKAVRGMSVSKLTTNEENFWPSITRTEDGNAYVVTSFPAIVRVDGLDTVRRIPPRAIQVTREVLEQARIFFQNVELSRHHAAQDEPTLIVPVRASPLPLNADLSTWDPKQFVTIDERSKQMGDWQRTKMATQAALRVAGDRLYAAFKTGDNRALENSGTLLPNLFKTGGAVDLMLATDPSADLQRKSAAQGDIRLLVSLVRGKPVAVLYRPIAATGPKNSAIFESPLRKLKFDDIEEVSQYVQLAMGSSKPSNSALGGDVEFSIPLAVLGLKPIPGTVLLGDIGLLRGDGIRTTQRAYWSNKATGLVSDTPSEAELTPQLWGKVKFVVDSTNQR